jgi:hypothetical protein
MTCFGPDNIRMLPFNHPVLERRDDAGNSTSDGKHVVLYSILSSPSGWKYADEPSDGNKNIIQDSVGQDAPWGDRILGGLTFVGIGAGIGGGFGGLLVGAVIGAAIALVVYIVISIICFFFGCGKKDGDEFQQHPAFDRPSSENTLNQPISNDIAPPGTTQSTGGSTPARTFDLTLIPNFHDRNLYGLRSSGDQTLEIVDDANAQEMLGWLAFPGGIGYQFNREVPGGEDVAGSSLRNYFDLFTKKINEVHEALNAVTYFEPSP